MKSYINPGQMMWASICKRPVAQAQEMESVISPVFQGAKESGDIALRGYTEKFDGITLERPVADSMEVQLWAKKTPAKLKRAIDRAYTNIRTFHGAQVNTSLADPIETQPNVICWRESRPIEQVGLYVPGGTAPLISTVLMLGVPAQLAGCREVVLCTPPAPDGSVNPAICYAASLVGVTTVVRAGGVQAVAAMTFGTESVPKVDKILGPGNQYVTAAKSYAQRFGVAIDIPAGPSEVMVLADKTARPEFVAADLLSQAEHGVDSQVVLIASSKTIAKKVEREIARQLADLPRKDIASAALEQSFSVVFDNKKDMLAFANAYAPEHLILSMDNPKQWVGEVVNAGSVFLGNYTPESAGDYASGTNHTLPTNGWARSYGGVSIESFCKYVTFQSITPDGLKLLSPTITALAEAEGLAGHARAVTIRES